MHDLARQRLHVLAASSDPQARAAAVVELGGMGHAEDRDLLLRALEDHDPLVAVSGAFACWLAHGVAPGLQRTMVALGSEREDVVMAAVHALGEMGQAAVGQLTHELTSRSANAVYVARVLGEIGGAAASAALRAVADDPAAGPELRNEAREALRDLEGEPA